MIHDYCGDGKDKKEELNQSQSFNLSTSNPEKEQTKQGAPTTPSKTPKKSGLASVKKLLPLSPFPRRKRDPISPPSSKDKQSEKSEDPSIDTLEIDDERDTGFDDDQVPSPQKILKRRFSLLASPNSTR